MKKKIIASFKAPISKSMGPHVRQVIPSTVGDLDPFVFLDHFGPFKKTPDFKGVPPHPHAGIATITYLLEGSNRHLDSYGHEALIQSGDLAWMQAGKGIIHAEGLDEVGTENEQVHGLQFWISLPAKDKFIEPDFFHYSKDQFPVLVENDIEYKIFAQLWHTGRVGHSIDKNGVLPVSASAIAIEGQTHFTSQGPKEYETPRELTTEEVKQIIQDYKQAAINAKEAGFDGVELHGAFGYLPNQFLVDGANKRNDEFGGSIENRSRFVLEIMNALVEVFGKDKAGIKLSPSIPYNGMIDSDPTALFSYLISELNKLPLAYIQLMQPMFPIDAFPTWPKDVLTTFGHLFDKTIIVNGGYDQQKGEQELENNRAHLVSYGSAFIANPDLPKRFELNAELNTPDRNTMYGGGEKGFTDYPFLENNN